MLTYFLYELLQHVAKGYFSWLPRCHIVDNKMNKVHMLSKIKVTGFLVVTLYFFMNMLHVLYKITYGSCLIFALLTAMLNMPLKISTFYSLFLVVL